MGRAERNPWRLLLMGFAPLNPSYALVAVIAVGLSKNASIKESRAE